MLYHSNNFLLNFLVRIPNKSVCVDLWTHPLRCQAAITLGNHERTCRVVLSSSTPEICSTEIGIAYVSASFFVAVLRVPSARTYVSAHFPFSHHNPTRVGQFSLIPYSQIGAISTSTRLRRCRKMKLCWHSIVSPRKYLSICVSHFVPEFTILFFSTFLVCCVSNSIYNCCHRQSACIVVSCISAFQSFVWPLDSAHALVRLLDGAMASTIVDTLGDFSKSHGFVGAYGPNPRTLCSQSSRERNVALVLKTHFYCKNRLLMHEETLSHTTESDSFAFTHIHTCAHAYSQGLGSTSRFVCAIQSEGVESNL